MNIVIDTTQNHTISITLKKNGNVISEKNIPARRQQAEVLLIEINKMLKKNSANKKSLEKIEVANTGGSFTSLRIGVITANALGYGLEIPVVIKNEELKIKNNGNYKKNIFNIVEPVYSNNY